MEQKMFASPLHKDPRLPELYDLYARKRAAQDRVRLLKKAHSSDARCPANGGAQVS
jgi:hypothetical protein